MAIKAVLFDLDGTLLPMDQSIFIKSYFGLLSQHLAQYGYEPKTLINAVWTGTEAMVKNNGDKLNEDAFWDKFTEIFGKNVRDDIPFFDEFYRLHFDKVQASCGYTPQAKETVSALKKMGLCLVLATNPIFPAIATQKRIAWAGLASDDFSLVTTYENSRHSKPNPEYYKDILSYIGIPAEECLMVGNDVSEDMIAQALGMKVFLMPACLINKEGKDISQYPSGDFSALMAYIKENL